MDPTFILVSLLVMLILSETSVYVALRYFWSWIGRSHPQYPRYFTPPANWRGAIRYDSSHSTGEYFDHYGQFLFEDSAHCDLWVKMSEEKFGSVCEINVDEFINRTSNTLPRLALQFAVAPETPPFEFTRDFYTGF